MTINKIKLMDGKTTVHEAHGNIVYKELLEELIDFYENNLTLHCIWDFTNATISDLSKDQIRNLAEKGAEYSKRRIGGKTAWVVSDKLTYGICRMAQTIGLNKDVKVELKIFYSKAKALRWSNKHTSKN